VRTLEESDTILMWTCAFRADVRDNSTDQIKKILKNHMDKKLIVAGCLPDKVDLETARKRLKDFDGKIKAAGIICNSSDSELSQDRLRRLNLRNCPY